MKIRGKYAAGAALMLCLAVSALMLCLTIGAMPSVEAAEANKRGRDYSELERQIAIANGLDSYNYTQETWEILSSAVEAGNQLLEGETEQSALDHAAEDIEYAIDGLVKMDYSALIAALDEVYAAIDANPELHDVWYRLDKAVDKARPLLVSGDQQAVDEMADQLTQLIAELGEYNGIVVSEPSVIVQEVEVEVPPSSDFCNIPLHQTWPILLLISVLLNVLLAAALGFVLFRKRKTADNTPLVTYDIDDDIDL